MAATATRAARAARTAGTARRRATGFVTALVTAALALPVLAGVGATPAGADTGGGLDPGFSSDGKATLALRSTADGASASLVQPDGKIVVAGFVIAGGGTVMVSRFNADGSFDSTFGGGDGWVASATAPMRGTGVAVARASDGKIVVAAALVDPAVPGARWGAVYRYSTTGALDGSFSTDGISSKLLPPGLTATDVHGVGVQTDGKVVVGLGLSLGSTFVARLTAAGGIDTTYSGDGYAGPFPERPRDLVLQPDNRAVLAGVAGDLGSVRRLTSTGINDLSYSSDGFQAFGLFNSTATFNAVTVEGNGKIVATGVGNSGSSAGCFTVVTFANGALDDSFNGGATVDPLNGHPGGCADVVARTDGRIVVAGTDFGNGTSGDDDFAAMQYKTDGFLDESYSGDGRVSVDMGGVFSDWSDRLAGIAIGPDQKVTLVGTRGMVTQAGTELARLTTAGALDSGFGVFGLSAPGFQVGASFAEAVTVDSTGRPVLASTATVGPGHGGDIVRYTATGTPDSTFGLFGQYGVPGLQNTEAHGVTVDGSTPVTAGEVSNGSNEDAFVYTAGRLATTTLAWGIGDDVANAVAVGSGGTRVIAGTTAGRSSLDFGLARFTNADQPDPSFSSDGKVTTDFGGDDEAFAVAVQPSDQKVVAGGGSGPDFAVARYTAAGVPDLSFSSDGKVTTDVGATDAAVRDIALDRLGRVLAAGTATIGGTNQIAVVRYTSAGGLDPTFGHGGIATFSFGGPSSARGVALQTDGRIVVAGNVTTGFASDMAVLRLNEDGSADPGFGTDGRVTVDFASSVGDTANAVAVQPDGRIVVAGSTFDATDGRVKVAVVRLKAATTRLSVSDVTVTEGDSGTTTATFTITRSGAPQTADVTFDYSTGGGTATPGVDYVSASGSRTMPPGTVTATVAVTINGDAGAESDEDFHLTISNVVNAAPLADAATDFVGVGTIVDDDNGTPPLITGFTPPQAFTGATVAVDGSGLTGATAVTFAKAGGGTVGATTFTVVDDGEIDVTVPNSAITGPVTVTTPLGSAVSPVDFKVKPKVQGFSPPSGPVGTTVTVTGKSLDGATAVTFGGAAAITFSVVSNSTVTAVVPGGAVTGPIAVTTPGGTATSQATFTVT